MHFIFLCFTRCKKKDVVPIIRFWEKLIQIWDWIFYSQIIYNNPAPHLKLEFYASIILVCVKYDSKKSASMKQKQQ